MKRASAAALAALALATAAMAQGDRKSHFAIWVETESMKMPGMPAIELPPGVQLPEGVQIPGMGGPTRKMTIVLAAPGEAPANAAAHVVPPAGLQEGNRLDLEIERPGDNEGPGQGENGEQTEQGVKFTIKRYWGSSRTVKPGQPDVTTFDTTMTPEMRAAAARAGAYGGYLELEGPDWIRAHWPNALPNGGQHMLKPNAHLPGGYKLSSTFSPGVEFELPANVDVLPAIELTSPDLADGSPDLAQPFVYRWKAIPNILGYWATMTGMIPDTNTMIIWSSSEVKTDDDWGWQFPQMAKVRELVGTTELMAPDRTEVIVPAGIFEGCEFVSFRMVGFGPGFAPASADPVSRVQTKTSLMVNFMDVGGGGEDEDEDE